MRALIRQTLWTAVVSAVLLGSTPLLAASSILCKVEDSRRIFRLDVNNAGTANVYVGESTAAKDLKLAYQNIAVKTNNQDGSIEALAHPGKVAPGYSSNTGCLVMQNVIAMRLTPANAASYYNGQIDLSPFYGKIANSDKRTNKKCRDIPAPELLETQHNVTCHQTQK